ncbi:MAG: hypothetical protein LAO07_18015 [Acidobacteriia bacterium]|nr:hypothetical protein [Terriglobia bacterium]
MLDLAKSTEEAAPASSLRRFWTAGHQPDSYNGVVISELVSNTLDYQPAFASLTTSEWHLIHDSSGRMELYHWPSDPQEKNNLADSPREQALAKSLYRDLQLHIANSYPPWRGPEYLSGLDQAGRPFAHESLFATDLHSGLPPNFLPAGATQYQYLRDSAVRPRHVRPVDEEMLRSLPYQ